MSWGYETRAAAVRIPGGSNAARRVEHRVAGADANPYLVLAAVLGAALEGIENRIEPPEPMAAASEALPFDWKQAIDAFERSEAVARIFAPVLRDDLRRDEEAGAAGFLASRSVRSSTRLTWRRCDPAREGPRFARICRVWNPYGKRMGQPGLRAEITHDEVGAQMPFSSRSWLSK